MTDPEGYKRVQITVTGQSTGPGRMGAPSMAADPFEPTCPFCGKHDVTGMTYTFRLQEFTVLTVRHADRRECTGTPPSDRKP